MTRRLLDTPAALVAGLGLAAGIHLGVGLQHGSGSHGTFFLAVGALQLVLALVVRERRSRLALAAVVALGVALAGTWVATRLPWLTDAPEPIGVIDVVATTLAILTSVIAGRLVDPLARPARRGATSAALPALALLAAVAVTTAGTALGSSSHRDHHHDDHHHHHDAQGSADGEPIFGDLFDGHGEHAGDDHHEDP